MMKYWILTLLMAGSFTFAFAQQKQEDGQQAVKSTTAPEIGAQSSPPAGIDAGGTEIRSNTSPEIGESNKTAPVTDGGDGTVQTTAPAIADPKED